jgi:hypothetical protein
MRDEAPEQIATGEDMRDLAPEKIAAVFVCKNVICSFTRDTLSLP